MNLTLNKKQFNDYFLSPINKLTNTSTLILDDKSITTLTHNAEGGDTIVLYGYLKTTTGLKEQQKLNIPDIKRLTQMIDCIDEEELKLAIQTNCIEYKSPELNFKYHLWEDGLTQTSILNPNKINKLTFDCEFDLTPKKISEILKASMVVPWPSDANKIYFYAKDSAIYGELTDKTIANLDSISFVVSNEYDGKDIKDVLPISLEVFRLFSGLKIDNIRVKINTTLKTLLFEIKEENLVLKYIISSLVK
jgi:hypothetical protein